MNPRRRPLVWLLAVGLVALAVGLAARARTERWFWAEASRAEAEMAGRHFGPAAARLARLSRSRPGRARVEYRLGVCEEALGHADAALAAWGRVPDDEPEAPRAALARGRLALDRGRYALAETCLERAARDDDRIGPEARWQLARLRWLSGQRDEFRRLLRGEAALAPDPSELIRILWNADTAAEPPDALRPVLEAAARAAPADDRVWLALGALETRAGKLRAADAWLARCERARPADAAVRRARLEWAEAADRPADALRAALHLPPPAGPLAEAEALRLRAWLAARSGDRAAERAALEALAAEEPSDTAALERLADLAADSADSAGYAALRRRKAVLDAARDRYRALMGRPGLAPFAAELGRAAEALGRRDDAEAWWALAARRDPDAREEAYAALARLARRPRPAYPRARTLADVLTFPGPPNPSPAPAHEAPGTGGALAFTDEAGPRGLAFTFRSGRTDLRQLPETMGGGVGLLDFDGDGRLDVYGVQGGTFPPPSGHAPFGDRLFRNLGGGRFADATAEAGLARLPGGYGFGVAVGDYDNDGRPDLFVTRWRSYALYHNLGGGRFEDATDAAGLSGDRDWPTSAAWADLDGDGDLDLYVCHYLDWDPRASPSCQHPSRPEHTYCEPRDFSARPDHLFRNDGGRFVDLTESAGIADRDGRGLGVLAADLDDDGRVDLLVANDTSANFFFRNLGGLRFAEQAHASGLASGASGGYLAGMGVACGDLDGDGRLDLAVTNFFGESTTLYHNFGGGLFSDRSAPAGLAAPTRAVLGFGLAALDADNDGRLDLLQANGHVNDYRPATPHAMALQIFKGDGAGRLVDASATAGPAFRALHLARGLAVGDLDDDGLTDAVVVPQDEPLIMLHNRSPGAGHSLTLRLEGVASNRDGVGASVTLTAGGRCLTAQRTGGGSYLSSGDPRLVFGLGPARRAEAVQVRWPSGRVDRLGSLAADRAYLVREGESRARPLRRAPSE